MLSAVCSDLSIDNGVITYNNESPDNRPVGTTATYFCASGYTLSGVSIRTCVNDSNWNGKDPVCQGEYIAS